MLRRKTITLFLALILTLSVCITGCGGGSSDSGGSAASTPEKMNDGTYTGRSSDFQADENGNGAGYGQAVLEIKDNAIVSCEFTLYELDGTVKDETYGADLSKENRLKAQKAVQAGEKYAAEFAKSGQLAEVDAISGATISYNEFQEAVTDALNQAAAE